MLKKFKNILFFIILLIGVFSCSRNNDNQDFDLSKEILEDIYDYDFFEARDKIPNLQSEDLETSFYALVNQYIENEIDKEFLYSKDKEDLTNLEQFVTNISKAHLIKQSDVDSTALIYYKIAEANPILENDSELKKILYAKMFDLTINQVESPAKKRLLDQYFRQYAKYVSDKETDFNYLNSLVYSQMFDFYYGSENQIDKTLFQKIDQLTKNEPLALGEYNQLQGIYYAIVENDYNKSAYYNDKAIEFYKKSRLKVAKTKEANILLNRSLDYYDAKDYDKALEGFLLALEIYPKSTEDYLKNKKVVLGSIANTYTQLNQFEKAKQFTLEEKLLIDSLKQYEVSQKMFEADLRYNVAGIQNQLNTTTKTKNLFKWQVFVLFPVAFFVTWLAYRYYQQYIVTSSEKAIIQIEFEEQVREKQSLQTNYESIQSQIQELEQEREETIDRLQQLKEVVTKEFIVLQDKSKVYVEELMYIQSDDHYLRVHLYEKKENFVRGKISKIIEELPPNFVRCHRSYIVNQNYIEKLLSTSLKLTDGSEVPVSKKYRELFTT